MALQSLNLGHHPHQATLAVLAIAALLLLMGSLLALPAWDLKLFFWLNSLGKQAPLTAQIITNCADGYWATPLLIILLASRMRLLASVIIAALCVHLSVNGLKTCFTVLRPCFEPSLVGQVFTAGPSLAKDIYSFPSGHSATAGLMAASFVACFGNKALVPAIVFSLAIAASRSMLGAHYPSDTCAGLALGLSAALGCFWLQHYCAAWPSSIRAQRWGYALVWLAAMCLLLRIAHGPMHHLGWAKVVSLLGCAVAAGVLLWQAVVYWQKSRRT